MSVNIQVIEVEGRPEDVAGTLVVGTKARLLDKDVRKLLPSKGKRVWQAMVERVSPGDVGGGTCTWLAGDPAHQLSVGVLPRPCSRHNSGARPHAVSNLVRGHAPRKGSLEIVAALERPEDAVAVACAVARAYPAFSRKTRTAKGKADDRAVSLLMVAPGGKIVAPSLAQEALDGVRLAGALVDAPTSELTTDAFVERAREVADEVGAAMHVIRGKDLDKRGFGGLWGVGKAAVHKPALVTLSLGGKPSQRDAKLTGKAAAKRVGKSVVWVGKGIVYDTGGLSLKTKGGMPGMKGDMAGAAAVLGAFRAAGRLGWKGPLHAVLCLAENAVGPEATRPDDVLTLYSGKTVEVNNTDAEGRLVLGDGVAWAARRLNPKVIVDMATLTGAQLTATGRRHAALVCSDEALEARAVKAGRRSGDLTHPLPFCPEFFRKEFKSKVADMKNSVADRANAQSSCAGQFVYNHLAPWKGPWLHVDIAGPATSLERGTGYGVALLLTLFDESA